MRTSSSIWRPLLHSTVTRYGSSDPDTDYPLLRAQFDGIGGRGSCSRGRRCRWSGCVGKLFARYGLDWGQGRPPPGRAWDASVG